MSVINTLIYLASIATAVQAAYINGWDQEANFNCPAGQIISHISSIHSNYYEDRRWEYRCRTPRGTGAVGYCIDSVIKVKSPMYDRTFGFRCCKIGQRVPSNCYSTGYVNNWDSPMDFNVPEGKAITQVFSFHKNFHEDRRWKFTVCTI
ncbi:hypothetical protein Btru_029195 [Bulinus truncatus]|nr:hypothetical protein Btru_029195 [Bulinus truncatus]